MRSATPLECREDPASSPIALHNLALRIIGDRGQDMHLRLAGRRGRVDAFGQADERYAETLQLVDQRDQMLE
jgi:hypothetical protein